MTDGTVTGAVVAAHVSRELRLRRAVAELAVAVALVRKLDSHEREALLINAPARALRDASDLILVSRVRLGSRV